MSHEGRTLAPNGARRVWKKLPERTVPESPEAMARKRSSAIFSAEGAPSIWRRAASHAASEPPTRRVEAKNEEEKSPGRKSRTAIPVPRSSARRVRECAESAAFAQLYGAMQGRGKSTAMDEMFARHPFRARSIAGRAARQSDAGLWKSTCISDAKRASGISSALPKTPPPAAFTRSSGASCGRRPEEKDSTAAASERSSATASEQKPGTREASRETPVTAHPARASRSASARPSPEEAPVTRALA